MYSICRTATVTITITVAIAERLHSTRKHYFYKPKMPSYKLVYFDSRGRAEAIRMAFAFANIPFEDARYGADIFAVSVDTTLGRGFATTTIVHCL